MHKPRPPYVLVIDQGGHSTRALVFDSVLTLVAQSQVSIQTFHPQARFVEHDASELVQSLITVLDDIRRQLKNDVFNIQSAGLACQRSSIVCWDRQSGEALTPVISWQDTRGHRYLEKLRLEQASIQQKTGLRLSPHYGASKMHWCLEHMPEVKTGLQNDNLRIGPLATWLAALLTNNPQVKADVVNAARTSLMCLTERRWDETLCDCFSVPSRVLPELADNDICFGEIDLGGHSVPLRYVTGDQPAALFALGVPDPSALYLNIGSGAFMQRVTGSEVKPVTGLINSLVESAHGCQLYSLEATINGAANALDWLSAREGVDVMPQLDEWLDGETDALCINAVGGLAAPWWRDDIESCFIGDTDIQSRAIAIIESILFLVRVNMDRMAEALDPPGRITVSGGLSRLDGLCSRLAAVTGIPVFRLQEAEATALGLARRLLPDVGYMPGFDVFAPVEDVGLSERYRLWLVEMESLVGVGDNH